jgi:Multiubiquitin
MNSHHEVRIHIDQTPCNSPNPTTGEALYILGKVSPGLELYREVGGDREDPSIPNDRAPVHLKADEHFHSGAVHKKEFTIVVNGKKKVVTKAELSFDELVALAFNSVPTGPNVLFTITYEGGPRENPEGTLMKGQSVKIKNGMIFNVKHTDRS